MVKLSHFLQLKNKIDKDVKDAIDRIDEAVAATGNGDIEWSSAPKKALDGAPGKDGKDGKQGAVGATGAPGLPGERGKDGADGKAGADGKDGKDGLQGVSVVDADIAFDNHLVLTLSDGSEIDCGDLMSEQTIQHITSSTTVRNGGGGEGGGHIIYNDGAALPQVAGLNFTGTGVSVQNVGDKSTVTITGSGATGPEGPQGPAGADGATGPKGDTGDTGATGATGATGPAGADGDTGPAGADGADGAIGPQGIQGIQGPTGADGADGDQGPQGLQGLQGDQGDQGPQGIQGIQGIQGDAGADGADGDQGIQGIQGDAGADGTDGEGVPVGGTTGQVLAKASGTNYDTEWVAAGGGGGDVSVEDEGTELTAAATSINFTGTGVTASNVGTDVTVTIDAGLSDLVDDTTPELGGTLDCLNERIEGFNTLQTDALTGTITSPPVSGSSYGRVVMNTNQTHDYSNGVVFGGVVIPAGVLAEDTFTIKQDASLFGLGSLFLAAPTIQNESATAADLASYYTLSATPTYKADTQDISIQSGPRSINVKPTLTVTNSGTLAANYCSNYWTQFAIDDGVTTTAVVHTNVGTGEGTAAASSQGPEVGFQMYEVAEKAMFDDTAVVNAGVAATSLSGKWMIHQGDNYQYPNRWNGGQYYKLVKRSGAQTLDETDHVVVHTGTSARTFTLPNITTANKGQEYVIIRDATATTTIDPDASDTINGGSAGAAITITTRYDSVRLISDGVSKWYSI